MSRCITVPRILWWRWRFLNSDVWVLLAGRSSIPCVCHVWYHCAGGLRSSGWDSGHLREARPLAPCRRKFTPVCPSIKLCSLSAALVGSFSYSQELDTSSPTICIYIYFQLGLPRWLSGKESTCQCRRHKKCRFNPRVGEIPWKRKWQPTPVFLPRSLMDRGVWRATVHRVTKSQTQLRMRTCTLPEHNGPNWPRLETEKQNKSDSEGRLEELRGLGYPEESGELKEWDTYSGFSFASIGKTD